MAGTSLPELDRFCHQYLQLEQAPEYPGGEILRRTEVQDGLYSRLFTKDALKFSPPVRYQVRILKKLLSITEQSIDDWEEHGVSDDLTSSLAEMLALPLQPEFYAAQQKSYVTYHLSQLQPSREAPRTITLLESRSLVAAAGTTGLRTWEAALHLGQFLCANPSLVKGKRVLELGAGTGYLSILCGRHLGATHVLASDGSDEVVAALPENFFLNGLEDSANVAATELRWGHALVGTEEAEWNGGRSVDVVLGADITYDASVVGALAGTIAEIFGLYPKTDVIIAATQRNEATFEAFLDACRTQGFSVDDLSFEVPPRAEQNGPFYEDGVRIRTCRVSGCIG